MSDLQPDLFEFDQERGLLSELLERSQLYRSSAEFKALLEFVARLRNFAPFNAMMLQIQEPGLRFAASEHDWFDRFQRKIKEGARPLIIMWPFGPFALVYDVADTEGEQLPDDVTAAFRADGNIAPATIKKFFERAARSGIDCKLIEYGDGQAGFIKVVQRSESKKIKPEYEIRINARHAPPVQFATVVHELAHLYLGHLGADAFLGIAGRRGLEHARRELEAESLAFLVCARNGVVSRSESYLANYVAKNDKTHNPDIFVLMRAAGQIESLLDLRAHTSFAPSRKDDSQEPLLSISPA